MTPGIAFHSRAVTMTLIRAGMLAAAAFALAACSAYEETVDTTVAVVGDALKPAPAPIPNVDLTNAKWLRLTTLQPESNPIRVAIVARDDKIGATRAVLKVPPETTVPPFWFTSHGTYTVLKGTFLFDILDQHGDPVRLTQRPGAFATLSPNLIQHGATAPGDEGLLYITVYGAWAPQFPDGAWDDPDLRRAAR